MIAMIAKIAITIFILALVVGKVSALFASPFPRIIDTPTIICAIAVACMAISFPVAIISLIWGL